MGIERPGRNSLEDDTDNPEGDVSTTRICPKCGGTLTVGTLKGLWHWYCTNEDCDYKLSIF